MSHDDHGPPRMEPLHGPVILALLIFGGLAYWLLTREQHPHGPPDVVRSVSDHQPRAPRQVPPTPAVPIPPRPATAATPPQVAPSTPSSPDCTASVTTDPPGVDVFWGAEVLGKTPLAQTAVPCGTSRVKLKHALFADKEVEVVVKQGENFLLTEKLAPGRSRLEMTSFPAGAAIQVNGEPVGTGNAVYVGTIGAEITVTATLPGYKPFKREVTLSTRRLDLQVEMEKQ